MKLTLSALSLFAILRTSSAVDSSSSICGENQIGLGIQTQQYSGTFAAIFLDNCTNVDFRSADDANMCGEYSFGSSVTCNGSTPSTVKIALSGNTEDAQVVTFSNITAAPANSNCNNAFGLNLNTTIHFCGTPA